MCGPSRARRPAQLLAVLAVIGSGCGMVKVVPPEDLIMRPRDQAVEAYSLPSGLQLLLERDTRTNLAGVFLVVGAGSANDPLGKEGLAHFVEHLAFRSRPAGLDGTIDEALVRAGRLTGNALTRFDATVFYEVGLARDLPELLRIEGLRMRSAVVGVDDAVRATELDVVRNELRQGNETGFFGEVLGTMQAAVFPQGHPYAHPVIGTLPGLSALTAADVDRFVEAHYRPDNMTLAIVGAIDIAATVRLLGRVLPRGLVGEGAPRRVAQRIPDAPPEVPPAAPSPGFLQRQEASVPAPEIWIGWSLPRSFEAASWKLELVASAARRRLARLARDDRDIATVRVHTVPGVLASLLLCQVELYKGEHPEKSRDLVLDELPRIWTSLDRTHERRDEYEFAFERRMVLVEGVSESQDLVTRGVRRAASLHFTQSLGVFAQADAALDGMRRQHLAAWAGPHVTQERARAVLFVPPAGGGNVVVEREAVGPSTDQSPPTQPAGQPAAAAGSERLRALSPDQTGRVTLRLRNGLGVVLLPRPGLPLLYAGLLLPAAPSSPSEAAAAAAARLAGAPAEHRNVPPETYGASIAMELFPDGLWYGAEGAAGNAEGLLASLAEHARTLDVANADWRWLQESTVPYLRRFHATPRRVAERSFRSTLLAGTPYALEVTASQLEEVSQAAARTWIQRTHTPVEATLVVAGEFDPAGMTQLVRESFEGWSGGPPPPAPASAQVAAGPGGTTVVVTDRPGATQALVLYGCRLPEVRDPAGAARQELAAALLRAHLKVLLRDKLGATYSSLASSESLRGGAAWLELATAVELAKLAPALAHLRASLALLSTETLPAADLDWAKLRLANSRALHRMTNAGAVDTEFVRARMGFPIELGVSADELLEITPEQVRDVFRACVRGQSTLSILGDEEAVRAAL